MNEITLKNKQTWHYILLLLLMFGCASGINKEQQKQMNKKEQMQTLLNNFYSNKEAYMKLMPYQHKLKAEYLCRLQESWAEIILKEHEIVPYLLTMENDISYSIYGKDDYNYFGLVKKMPNNVHALYLIEAIIKNDYLFNRIFFNELSEHLFFYNDSQNYILTEEEAFRIGGRDVVHLQNEETAIPDSSIYKYKRESWKLYKDWYKYNYITHNQPYTSPLEGSKFIWNHLRGRENPKKDTGTYFEVKRSDSFFPHRDFIIGEGRK